MTKCPGCAEEFDQAVALKFHLKDEHPGLYDAARPLFNRLISAERSRARAQSEGQISPTLLHFWRNYRCPCGRPGAEHLASIRAGRSA